MPELLHDKVSHDLIDAIEDLLAGAKAGQIVGLTFCAVLKRQRYIVNIAGTCVRNLTHARGMLCALSDQLGDLIRQRDPGETQ